MSEPCMSCGEDRRLPAPHRCKHQANHHPAPSLAERERLLDLIARVEDWLQVPDYTDYSDLVCAQQVEADVKTVLREYDRLGKEES